jgi:hypothetical protein
MSSIGTSCYSDIAMLQKLVALSCLAAVSDETGHRWTLLVKTQTNQELFRSLRELLVPRPEHGARSQADGG